ncbi:MAG: LacI family DNA-binding transcriptional regulator [Ramlibacter sp.]|uniref:LacI family DNA-binding transcriptional regulator n=1 Tax=Ramlibacter sp. TaxID=1917967 RepID=UPI0026251CD8|nr:LacI family DNA-binding transcriptional regulator [Ramlibacter sp.]MDH4376209.1 LacI family DNA-binding transcriptional regulator [Ramlibacter sp.]
MASASVIDVSRRPECRPAHVTSRDVAAAAGVSQSAVSRCFTPGASVAPQTRERVMKVAADLGYRPNLHARTLSTGRTRIIGVVLAHLDNLFYPRFLQLLTERLQAEGMQLLLFVADGRQGNLLEQLLQYRVDGIVLAATTLHSELAKACAQAGIPVVLFNRVADTQDSGFHSVQTNQAEGARQLTRFLLDNDHRRIAYLAGSQDASTNQAREQGCRQALAEGRRRLFAYGEGDYRADRAQGVVRGWYVGDDGARRPVSDCPDAIVVADDQMALAVMDTLRHELGLQVPEQVSVVGFDDVPQAAWAAYQLTTYTQPLPEMIESVLQLLTAQLKAQSADAKRKPRGKAVVLTGQLQIRQSARQRSTTRPRR